MADSRLIRRAILDSEKFNSLSTFAQNFYFRLLLVADDYGLYDARKTLLRCTLYPFSLEKVSESDVVSGLAACEKAGLIRLYSVEGKEFLQITNYGQRKQARPKYPLPPCATVEHGEARCATVSHRGAPLKTETQTQSETHTKSESESKSEARPRARAQEAPPPENVEEVVRYMRNQPNVMLNAGQLQLCAESFFGEFGAIGWTLKGQPVRDWHKLVHSYMAKWQTNENRPRGKGGGGGGKKWNISNAATVNDNRYHGL